MPEDFNATTRHYWEMAERVGARIAGLPFKAGDAALAGTERCFREAGSEQGVGGQQLERIVDIQMRAIRQVVADIDLSGKRSVTRRKP
jgi:hypothetical protein